MEKQALPKLLNKKTKRKKISHKKNNSLSIDINNSLFSFEDLEEDEKNKIFKINKNKKSNIIKNIEKSKIEYTKCNYIYINNISYKCKKLKNIPSEILESINKTKLFLRLINYNTKKILIIGYSKNLLIYEIINNNIYLVNSLFKEYKNNIDYIFLLNENSLSKKIEIFLVIKNSGFLYEFDLQDNSFKTKTKNIKLIEPEDLRNYRFKNVSNNILLIYNEMNILIYNLINNEIKKLELNLEEYDNIHYCQKISNDLYAINTDKKIIIYDIIIDSILYTINTELHFYWVKILILNNNKFLLYSNSDIDLYDFDYISKKESPKLNGKLQLNNIKNIQKIKQISNGDLIINYNFYNLLIYDMNKNIIKDQIKNKSTEKSIFVIFNIFKEIEPNIIVYKNNSSQINFLNVIKGEILGKFIEGDNIIIKDFRKIKYYFIENSENDNNKMYYFILTKKNCFIIYK